METGELMAGEATSIGLAGGRGLVGPAILPSYDPDAKNYFDRMSSTPETTRRDGLNIFIKDWKAAGLWDLTGAMWLMASHDAQAQRLNVKAEIFNLTAVGAPLFTVDRGTTFDGASSYFRTGFVPGAADTLYQQDSAHMGLFIRTSEVGTFGDLGARDATTVRQSCMFCGLSGTPATMSPRMNVGDASLNGGSSFSVSQVGGYSIGTRVVFTQQVAHKDANSLGTSTLTSTLPSSFELFIGAINQAGTPGLFSPRQYSVAHVGLGLTLAQRVSANTILRNYLSSIGASAPP